MNFIIGLFWLGLLITAALIVFQLVLTIGTLIVSAVVGAIALIAEKIKER